MADEIGLNSEIKRLEKTSLQKFKNQNRVLKKFGKDGLKVYRAIRKRGISIEELMGKVKNVEQEKLFEILTFLKEKKMIETLGGVETEEVEVEEETEMAKPEGIISEKEVRKEKKKPPEPPTVAPEAEVPPEEEKEAEPVEEEGGPIAPAGEIEPEEEAVPEEEEEEIEPEGLAPIEPEEEAVPEPEAEEEELPVLEEEEIGPAEEGEEEELVPLELEETEPEEEEAEEEEEIAPHEGEEEEEPEEEEDIFLTPGERKIKAEYGQVGIDVYNLIDGQRTAEEIMKSTGVTETKLIEMLDFMEKKGIIKLEHPGARKPKAGKMIPPSAEAAAKEKEVGFAPMLEEKGAPAKPLGGELGKEFTLDVPVKKGGNMFKELQIKANVMIKYKKGGTKAFELVNGSRDSVEIALKAGVPLFRVYKVLNYVVKEGVVELKPATREEIKRKYGEDGYSVYKKYGREGVMLYQLIGKDLDLREMANQTSEDKKKVVEIFMFIHKLLGIELPIDEDVLLERLESTEPNPT